MKEAAKALEIASVLDPLGPAVEGLRASLMSARGDPAMAIEIVRAAWTRWPDSAFIWYIMWTTLCVAKRTDEAETLAATGVPPRRAVVDRDVGVLRNYVSLLRLDEAQRQQACDAMLSQLATQNSPLPLSTCIVAAGYGCAERAFDLIENAFDTGRGLKPDNHDSFGMARAQAPLQLFVATGGKPVWAFDRFPRLAAKLGLAQYWVESGKWPDCAAYVDYDFKAACKAALA